MGKCRADRSESSGGDGRDGDSVGGRDKWLRLWAYGTSPHGLGLTDRAFWMLSPREYYALREVEQARVRRWAESQAMRINLKLREGAEPFTADDFMGLGNRAERERERHQGLVRAAELRKKLAVMRPLKAGEKPPDDLPKWARG